MMSYFVCCFFLLTSLGRVSTKKIKAKGGETVCLFENVEITEKEVSVYINGGRRHTLIATWNTTTRPIKTFGSDNYKMISMDSNRSIWIANVDKNYEGKYSILNSQLPEVELIILAPLSVDITNGLTVIVLQGQSVMLTCAITGLGNITMWWTGPAGDQLRTNFNYTVGAYNSNTRLSSLTINSVTASDAGRYTCHGLDSSGTQESSTQLTVIAPLTVSIDNGKTLYGPVDSDVIMTCSILGSGAIHAYWIGPRGNNLTSSTNHIVTSYNTGTRKCSLTILMLSTNDSGPYICRATDAFGSTAQGYITLTAYVPLRVSIDNGITLSRPVGNDATIICSVSGSGTFNVVWTGPFGNTLTSTTKHTITSNINTGKSALAILSLSVVDSGSYTCRVTDAFGSTAQESIQLKVYAPLTVSIDDGETISRSVDSAITIRCSVSGSGIINVFWISPSGNELKRTTKHSVDFYNTNTEQSALTILVLSTNHSGHYICKATDGSGSMAEDSIALTVYDSRRHLGPDSRMTENPMIAVMLSVNIVVLILFLTYIILKNKTVITDMFTRCNSMHSDGQPEEVIALTDEPQSILPTGHTADAAYAQSPGFGCKSFPGSTKHSETQSILPTGQTAEAAPAQSPRKTES